jgi:hypothetical protein
LYIDEIIQAEQLILSTDNIDPTITITEKSQDTLLRKDSSLNISEFIQEFMSKNSGKFTLYITRQVRKLLDFAAGNYSQG